MQISGVPNRINRLDAYLRDRAAKGLLRRPVTVDGRSGVEITIDGKRLVNFCSNDYLGLACHPRLISAWQRAAGEWGVGAAASPLVCGRHRTHEELEETLAGFCGRERALLFPSGFQANLGVITALAGNREDHILMDRLCHASLIDAALLARGRLRRFQHASADSLQRQLEGFAGGLSLVVTESVFSMDGDMAPLAEYAPLCRRDQTVLFVDDAHAFGVLGETGRGGLEQHGLGEEEVPLLMATFGKAVGVSGAFVAGPSALMELLIQRARPYIYSTAMPPSLAATVREALDVVRKEGWRRRHLSALIRRFRSGAEGMGLNLTASSTPIQPLIIGDPGRSVAVSEELRRHGFFVAAIRPPTVPENSARLRITLTAGHSIEQVEALLAALAESMNIVNGSVRG